MDEQKVNLKQLRLTIPEALQRLYNASAPQGIGAYMSDNKPMTLDEAKDAIIAHVTCQFRVDYLNGRPIKVDFSEEELDLRVYDHNNGGPGAGRRAIIGPQHGH